MRALSLAHVHYLSNLSFYWFCRLVSQVRLRLVERVLIVEGDVRMEIAERLVLVVGLVRSEEEEASFLLFLTESVFRLQFSSAAANCPRPAIPEELEGMGICERKRENRGRSSWGGAAAALTICQMTGW